MGISRLEGMQIRTHEGLKTIGSATYDGIRTNPETLELCKMVDVTLESGEQFTGSLRDIEGALNSQIAECDHDWEDMGGYWQCTYPDCHVVKSQ